MMKLRFFHILAMAAALCSCSVNPDEEGYLKFLTDNTPVGTLRQYKDGFLEQSVRKTLEVREKMNWDIPEHEFRYFVLPVQMKGQRADLFRLTYADSLCRLVKGMSMEEAAVEINLWCLAQANYSTEFDSNGDTPMVTMLKGGGLCGPLAELTVAALRAVGLPARKASVMWSHSNDGHSWAEVWADGDWHFMGATEPEPIVDKGWVDASAPRAMLISSDVFGDYDGPEFVTGKEGGFSTISLLPRYADTHIVNVTVMDKAGQALSDATVDFGIFNRGKFVTLCSGTTDREGKTSFLTGLGDIIIWARKGHDYNVCCTKEDNVQLRLTYSEYTRERFDFTCDIPVKDTVKTPEITEEMKELFSPRIARADSIRIANHIADPSESDVAALQYGADKPHIPEVDLQDMGNVFLRVYPEDISKMADQFSVYQVNEKKPVMLGVNMASAGSVMVFSGTRGDDGRVAVRMEFHPIPEGTGEINLPIIIPPKPASKEQMQ